MSLVFRPALISLLFALLAVASPALARELTLEEALAHADTNRDHLTAMRRADIATADVGAAKAAFDPSLVASTNLSGRDAAGFLAGFPTDSHTESSTSSVGVRGSTAFGTEWELGADLGRDLATTTASLGGVATEQTTKTWNGLVDLTVSQDVLAPFRQSNAAIAARQAAEQAEIAGITTERAEETALITIANAWWSWSSAWRLAENAERALTEAQALEAQVQAQLDEGQVARLELTRVTSERLAAQSELLTAQASVLTTADQLLLAMGLPPGEELTPGGSGEIAGGEVEEAASIERALQANRSVLQARLELENAERAQRDAKRSGLPELTASGSVGMASLSEDAMGALSDLANDGLPRWAIGVDFSVPLGGRAASNARSRAEATVDIARIALTSAEEVVRADVRAAVAAVGTARASAELAIAQLEVARETESGESARVEEGASRLDDLVTARNARLAAEASLVEAEAQRAGAELDLLQLEGRLGGNDA